MLLGTVLITCVWLIAGRFRRYKWVFIHWSGPSVPMVKRGQWNSASHAMDQLLSKFGRYHMEMTSVRPAAPIVRSRTAIRRKF